LPSKFARYVENSYTLKVLEATMQRHTPFFGAALGGWPFGFLPSGAVQYVPLISSERSESEIVESREEEVLPALFGSLRRPIPENRPFVA
jgi:hypothetical protein